MFADLLRRMTAPEPEKLPEPDVQLALAALLVRIAKADDHYAEAEVARIDAVLAKEFNLNEKDVNKLRSDAEILESEAPDTVRFTRAIKDAVAYEDRAQVVEALWSIVLADGERDEEENALMRMVAPMLGLNDRESAEARQRAEK